jgi:hypothetical protein
MDVHFGSEDILAIMNFPLEELMSFENTAKTLHALHSELCATMRRGEMLWYGMASDYQSKYAFSADYDTALKHGYYDRATACREIAEQLEALSPPTGTEDILLFVAALKDAAARCPQHPEMHTQLERLVGEMKDVVSMIGTAQEGDI